MPGLLGVSATQWMDGARTFIIATIDDVDLCVPNDPNNADRQRIQREWEDKGKPIGEPPPPPPSPVPETISDRQFFQGLAIQGVITKDEALAAVKTGAMPAALEQLIAALPAGQQFGAEMIVSGAVEFHRSSALVEEIRQNYHWTPDQVDGLWRSAAAL